MKREIKKTNDKLKELSSVLGNIDVKKSVDKRAFKTSEVVILVILTAIIGILIGSLVTYNLSKTSGERLDSGLEEFIENYEYIVNNYYGDIDEDKLLSGALAGMMSTLDKNSTYMGDESNNFNVTLEGSYKGIGVEVIEKDGTLVISKVMDNSPAKDAGLKSGDILLKLNGKSMSGKSSAEFASIINENNKVKLVYERDGKNYTAVLKPKLINLKSVTSKLIDNKVGYIDVSIFANNTYEQFKNELSKLQKDNISGLIIDLRGNVGGHLVTAEKILSLFLDSSHPIYKIKDKNNIETFYSEGKMNTKYKIVILVDENSASASEVVASALKEQYGATIIGIKTYGKGTVQELQTLPNGQQYKLTTKEWLTSKGNSIDGVGITPDIIMDESDKNINFDDDPYIMKALEQLG